jgi:uroporphyrinogen-III synthase
VLIPRAPGRGEALAALIEGDGGTAVVAPLISRADADGPDLDALRDAVEALRAGAYGWVAITSVNAVTALRAATEDDGFGAWPVRWAAVGPATARALRRAGAEPELVAVENSAVGMLAEWPDAHASSSTSRVLLPLGDLAEPTLERGLAERGYTPVRITAYRTVSHPAPPEVVADWAAGRIRLVVLTSGSVAREVARQLGPRSDVLAVAIGQPTRRAAEGTGQRVAAVATDATDDALFSAIIEAADQIRTPPTTLPEDQ